MRPEPPPRFHAGVLERWGLRRALPPAGRMLVRNLARRPLRFAANVAGIAIAVSLLVMMSAMLDGVRYLMSWQFTIVQREDVQVLLDAAARPRRAERVPCHARGDGGRAVPPCRRAASQRLPHEARGPLRARGRPDAAAGRRRRRHGLGDPARRRPAHGHLRGDPRSPRRRHHRNRGDGGQAGARGDARRGHRGRAHRLCRLRVARDGQPPAWARATC